MLTAGPGDRRLRDRRSPAPGLPAGSRWSRRSGRAVTPAACAPPSPPCVSFIPGALLGGVATFGALAAAGSLLHGAGGRIAYGLAAAIALLAAVAEARGMRIVPQIRRQVPEHWRRVMPLPLAAFLYGILLGLGFTTFVLSFGVWALAGISLALGDPRRRGRDRARLRCRPGHSGDRDRPVLRPRGRDPGDRPDDPAPGDLPRLPLRRCAGAGDRRGRGAHRDAGGRGGAGRGRRGRALGGEGRARLPEGRGSRDPPQGRTRHPAARSSARDRRPLHRGESTREDCPPRPRRPGLAGRLQGDRGGRDRRLGALGRLPHPPGRARPDQGSQGLPPRRRRSLGDRLRQASGGGRRSPPGRAEPPVDLPPHARLFELEPSPQQRWSSVCSAAGANTSCSAPRRWLVSEPSVWARSFAYVRTTNERQQLRVRRRHGRGIGKLVLSLPATSFRDRDHDPGHHRLPTRLHPPDRRRSAWNLIATSIAPGRVYATLLQEGPQGRACADPADRPLRRRIREAAGPRSAPPGRRSPDRGSRSAWLSASGRRPCAGRSRRPRSRARATRRSGEPPCP